MDYLAAIYNLIASVPDFFIAIFEFLNNGIVEFFISFGAYMSDGLTVLFISVCLTTLDFIWAIFRVLLVDLDISHRLSTSFDSFNSDTLNMILFFKIPESLSMILSAFVTRFVMRLIPFVG